MTTFADLGLSPNILKALEKTNFTAPTPIQVQAIPQVMEGRDLMGLAQTGTGKTAAFGLPLLHRLLDIGHPPGPRNVRALVLAPTRELVSQIHDNFMVFTKGTAVKLTMVVGGASIHKQSERLARGTDVLIATPGRLIDLLERGAVSLEKCGYLVLDEADHMLDMGFIHALRRIAKHIPVKRQTLLFSATMPKDIEEIADTYLRNPVRVQVAPPGKPVERIVQGVYYTPQGDKAKLLETYLKKHPGEQALVFGRTKHGSEKLMKLLVSWGFKASSIHGNKSQNQRERTLAEFRAGDLDVLVATDVAARGIDIPGVRHVYNYDMPNVPENYVHRIGRTARAGAEGNAIAFCAPAEMEELQAIEKVLKKPIPVVGGAPWAMDVVKAAVKPGQNRGRPQGAKPGGRPQGAKPQGAKPQGQRAEGGKPFGAKPQSAKPQGAGRSAGGLATPKKPQGARRPANRGAMAS
ncbi:DEAD/DEAH box helicase [Gemmobacter fulvus]|uniref:DEAD-box ATP-dependent RNA helicase RhpA n=1 Tax=Gemmobacter fulvus TaxID=2840474 RepID=A0A975S329_9RHOB|nr:DEAD/DEAH box helicase [Gemmobacter fulvus]MBT9247591.1 DEAD/DEAH box helicase [Gemmobacter fulvus]MDQ1847560.1 DEAD/DEAH box helicase [Gemmobacter fulvus]QWK92046.1 DEAD/DEAH box helicase [Gemmobacter fulvus]